MQSWRRVEEQLEAIRGWLAPLLRGIDGTNAMTTDPTTDPARRLATLEQPPPPRMPPAELRIRLKTSPWVRHLLPTRLVVARAESKGGDVWDRRPGERESAIAVMETILAGTPRAHEVNELARRHLIEHHVGHALFWQPWSVPRLDEQSDARVRQALDADRAVLLSACHTGPHYTAIRPFAARGNIPYSVAGMWYFEEPPPGYWGRRLAHWRKRTISRAVPARGSFPILRAILEQGEVLYVCFDMPGPHRTDFLGKPAMLADGTARLALETGALILPVRSRREGHRTYLDVAAPIEPHDFAGVDQLHDALATLHERWILELPEQMEDPRSFGWDEWATPAEWKRPKSADRPT
jgi:hypothetical protein